MTMQPDELKTARKGAGMSQAQLAEAIGMARETIGAMERGAAPIELRTALAVRFVTDGNIVGLRDRAAIHRHVAELLTSAVQGRAVGQDEHEELAEAVQEWSQGQYGATGIYLIMAANHLLLQMASGLGSVMMNAPHLAELGRVQHAWNAIA